MGGGLLIVSQFTLAADTSSGNRPGFTGRPPPNRDGGSTSGCSRRAARHGEVAQGEFGADMKVHLVNDGPVTIPLTLGPA